MQLAAKDSHCNTSSVRYTTFYTDHLLNLDDFGHRVAPQATALSTGGIRCRHRHNTVYHYLDILHECNFYRSKVGC